MQPRLVILTSLFILGGCRSPAPDESKDETLMREKTRNFQLPPSYRDAAPHMRSQLLSVLHFDSPSFEVKPLFVFVDDGEVSVGPLSALVTHFTFFHVAIYRQQALIWSGSVLLDPARGTTVFSKQGHVVDVIVGEQGYRVQVESDGETLEKDMPFDTDLATWMEGERMRVFAVHYRLPNEDVLGHE